MKLIEKSITGSDVIISLAPKLALSIGMALIIALSARLGFMTPFSIVPVTLQVAAVLLAGFVMGPLWGALSVVWYIAIGLMGAPVFAMGVAGPLVLIQPSFGYLLAFPIAAWIVGTLSQRFASTVLNGITISIIGVAVIYIVGASWLSGYLIIGGMGISKALLSAWTTGIAPFVIVDSLKALLVAGIWCGLPGK